MGETNISVKVGGREINARIGNNQPITVKFKGVVGSLGAPTFYPFTFIAIDGQTSFPLGRVPADNGYYCVNINGTPQDRDDFTLDGENLVFDEALDAGDKVYGLFM